MCLLDKCGQIADRKIILYGEQEEIIDFIMRYTGELQIQYAMTDYKEVEDVQPYSQWNIQTFLFEDVTICDELIVICDRLRFDSIYMRLEYLGKKEYVDYISCKLVDALLYHKKLMMCMGTQLLGQIATLLNACSNVTSEWSVIYYSEDDIMEPYMNQMREYKHISQCGDAYVYSDCEKDSYYLKKLEQKILSPDCKIIKVADYGFAGYYPQIDRNRNHISNYMLRERLRFEMSYETLVFSRADMEIERLCGLGMNAQQIITIIANENYITEQKINDNYLSELNRFRELEQNADVKLSDFLEQHSRECLCRNLNEWNEPVVSYVAEQVIQILGLPEMLLDITERQQLIEEHSGSEILIYPCVRRALELPKVVDDKNYKVTTFCSEKKMNFNEYVTYLVEYIHRAMEIMRYTGCDRTLEE